MADGYPPLIPVPCCPLCPVESGSALPPSLGDLLAMRCDVHIYMALGYQLLLLDQWGSLSNIHHILEIFTSKLFFVRL